ncbi:hypothetical protein DSUL_20409 [Desulfovibrionales bacterium]
MSATRSIFFMRYPWCFVSYVLPGQGIKKTIFNIVLLPLGAKKCDLAKDDAGKRLDDKINAGELVIAVKF